jgi:hypothetical protein
MLQIGWSVGQTTHQLKIFVIAARRVSGTRSKRRNRLAVGSVFVRLNRSVLLSIGVASSIVLNGLRERPPCRREGYPVSHRMIDEFNVGGGSDPRLLRTVYGKQRAPSRAVWRADE